MTALDERTDAPSGGTLMSTMTEYTAAEWKAISAAPAAAALAIILSDSGRSPGDAENTTVVAKAVSREMLHAPEIVRAVAERFSGGAAPELPALQEGNHVPSRDALIATVRIAVRAIEMKSPTEVERFKAWLALVAAKVCHGMSPSGGGTQVSQDRQDTIERLAEILAVTLSSRGTPWRKSPTPSERPLAGRTGVEPRKPELLARS
jgi:hypothetical protein